MYGHHHLEQRGACVFLSRAAVLKLCHRGTSSIPIPLVCMQARVCTFKPKNTPSKNVICLSCSSTTPLGVILLLRRSRALECVHSRRPMPNHQSVGPRLRSVCQLAIPDSKKRYRRDERNRPLAFVSRTNTFVHSHRFTTTQGMALCCTARATERSCSTTTHTTTRTPA